METKAVGVVSSPPNLKMSYNPKGIKNYLHTDSRLYQSFSV